MYGDVCLEKTYRIPATLRCSFSLLRQSEYFGRKNVTIILASVDARPLRTPQNATFDLSSATQNDYCVHPLRTQQTDYMPSTRAFRTNVRNLYLQRRKQIHTRYGLILNMALQQYTRYRVRVYPPFLHWQWHTATQKKQIELHFDDFDCEACASKNYDATRLRTSVPHPKLGFD